MSDAHGHDHHGAPSTPAAPLPEARLIARFTEGGHEVDQVPSKNLFGFLAALSVILVVAGIFVYQLFVSHSEADLKKAADQPFQQLVALRTSEHEQLTTWGKVTFDGKVVGYRMPVADAKALVLRDPARFSAAAPPAGWVHPDDAKK